jgi:hypothetical protein
MGKKIQYNSVQSRRITLKENNIDVVIEHRFFTASEDAKNILKQGPNR